MFKYLWVVFASLAIGLSGGAWMMKQIKDKEILLIQNEHLTQVAEQEKARADLAEVYRLKEKTWNAAVEQINLEREKERIANEKVNTNLRVAAQRLRNKVAALNARPVSGDTLTACRERSTTIGNVFGGCTEALTGMGAAAERHSGEVRTLKKYIEVIRQ